MNQHEFEAIINFRKQECNRNGFNALHISVEELAELCGSTTKDYSVIAEAMKQCMLEGDSFENSDEKELSVVYYCDNLSPSRRKLF
ncbi:MAG: hypothetical protein K6A40_03515 [Solobacterium sp.]|nr:hypothetical protein [Solobacterium sp.]